MPTSRTRRVARCPSIADARYSTDRSKHPIILSFRYDLMPFMTGVRDHPVQPLVPTRVALLEVAVACSLFVIAGYVWLHPASKELLGGNAAVMVGDNTDSVTNVWQYQLVLDTLRKDPLHLFWG